MSYLTYSILASKKNSPTNNSLDLEEVCGFYKKTVASLNDEQTKLDERMQPIPAEMHGSVTRSPLEKISQYEDTGEWDQGIVQLGGWMAVIVSLKECEKWYGSGVNN